MFVKKQFWLALILLLAGGFFIALAEPVKSEAPDPFKGALDYWSGYAEVASGGFAQGNHVRIALGNQEFFADVEDGVNTAGLYVVAVYSNQVILRGYYNTYMRAGMCAVMLEDFEQLPTGSFVVVAAKDEPTRLFDEDGQRALEMIGAETGLLEQDFRTSYYCMGVKGLGTGAALEEISSKQPLLWVGAKSGQPLSLELQANPLEDADIRAREKNDRVKVQVHRRGKRGNVSVSWLYPQRLRKQFKACSTDDARAVLGAAELLKQAKDGDRESAYKLGYLYLYGMGVPRDLAEAESRFRLGLEMKRPMGARWLAWELIAGNESDRDPDKAAEFALASLELGYWKAAYAANHVAYHFARVADPPRPEKAIEMLSAVLAADPGHEYALMLGARIYQEQGNDDLAWELATRLLALPDADVDNRLRARAVRLKVAQSSGRTEELDKADVMEPLAYLLRKVPRPVVIFVLVVSTIVSLLMLALMVFLTRRSGQTGPGLLLTAFWIIIPAISAGIWIHDPRAVLAGEGCLLLAVCWSLSREHRKAYFPVPAIPSVREFFTVFGAVLGCLGVVYACGTGYSVLYERLMGHPLEIQFISVYLRTESVFETVALFLMVGICMPLVEEIAFRGFLIDWFRRRMAWPGAIFFVSVIFGFVHGWTVALPITLLGLAAGWLRMRYKSLWPAFLLHALNNIISLLIFWLVQ